MQNTKRGHIETVKAQLARKNQEARKHRPTPPQNLAPKIKAAKPAKDPAFFNPDERGNWLV